MTQCMLSVCMLHHSVMSNKQTKLERNKSTENDGERGEARREGETHTIGKKAEERHIEPESASGLQTGREEN